MVFGLTFRPFEQILRKERSLVLSLGYEYLVRGKNEDISLFGRFCGRKGSFPDPGASYPSMGGLGLMDYCLSRIVVVYRTSLFSRINLLNPFPYYPVRVNVTRYSRYRS